MFAKEIYAIEYKDVFRIVIHGYVCSVTVLFLVLYYQH